MNEESIKKLKKIVKLLEEIKEDWDTCGRDKGTLRDIIEECACILHWNKKK